MGPLDRRDLLKVGSISLAATALPASVTQAAAIGTSKATSVIYLWMAGGVTHIDSFDPKPQAPAEIRGTLTDIQTSLPGVHFSETIPELAKIADRLAILRSYSHDIDDHLFSQVYTLSGRKVGAGQLFSEPNIGSIISYLKGPRGGLPAYIAVPGFTRPGPPPHNLFVGGWLGRQHAPFNLLPDHDDFAVGEKLYDPPAQIDESLTPGSLSLSPEVTAARLSDRAQLRASFDTALRRLESLDAVRGQEAQHQNALRLLSTPNVRDAFDLAKEDTKVRDAYGRTKIGGRCLMARRLVEAGARFVMVDYGYDPDYGNIWDNHNAPVQNHPPIQQMCKRGYHLAGMDKAFAALITDLGERGLLDSTLVVFLTEFGRTPRINPAGGRDHWGKAGSLFFTGGGTRVGQVIGGTDGHAAAPTTHPYSPADVAASIYAALGVKHTDFVYDLENRPRPILDKGDVIPELF